MRCRSTSLRHLTPLEATLVAEIPRMNDLREWLDVVDSFGALQRVSGAHWDLELAQISELNYRRGAPPALLFDSIADYAPGHRVLTSSVSDSQRTGLTLRLG